MTKKKFDQRTSSYNLDPMYLEGVGQSHTLEVKKLVPLEALTGLRVLFTRIAFGFRDTFAPEEWLYIDSAIEVLSRVKDLNFLANHWVRLETVNHCYKLSKLALKRKLKIDKTLIFKALTNSNDPSIKDESKSLIPEHDYFGNFSEWSVRKFIKKTNLLIKKRLPPVRYVGVGYRDKGSRRNPSVDARPAWQDVASSPHIFDRGRKLDSVSLKSKAQRVRTLNTIKSFQT